MSILGIIWFIICTACAFLLGNIVMLDIPLWTLLLLIPFFIVIVFLPVLPTESKKLRTRRLRITNKGSRLLKIFLASMILVLGFNIPAMCGVWETSGIPAIGDAGWKWTGHILLIVLIENIVFWNGMIRIYLSSEQLRVKYRLVGFLCGMIPIVHLVVLLKMIRVCDKEVKFENDKIILNESRAAERICATKYPILMVHGVFFRDFRFFNYWGRIPEQLEINGAKVFYGNQQSAASVEESGKELAERIKKVCEETGSEKVNIIAHSKGGLDTRYAVSKLGIAPYVASITTVNTPHRGCEFADYLLGKAPQKLRDSVAAGYNAALRKIGDFHPDFISAVTDLTASKCRELNQEMEGFDMKANGI